MLPQTAVRWQSSAKVGAMIINLFHEQMAILRIYLKGYVHDCGLVPDLGPSHVGRVELEES